MGQSTSTIEYSPTISTLSGPVRGKVFTFDEKKYDAFLGIPLAQPPVGKLRFKKPQPVEAWTETRDCLQFGQRCPQYDDFLSKRMNIVGMNESDCLTVNVIAPREKSEEWANGYPVMAWVHGGGFKFHSSSNYGDSTAARNLCSKDVVFVSLNYRLSVFGFFSTGDDLCKGNLGLWDQTMALRWVKENIAAFGGDPENITIFGQSAGGASVDLLSLSPHSRDLFRRVIPMAGSAECSFAVRTNHDQAEIGRKFARHLGWKGEDTDTKDLLEFMSTQSAHKMCTSLAKEFHFEESGHLPFVPNIDGDFLPKSISELRREIPKREVLTGLTDNEGLTMAFFTHHPCTKEGAEKYIETAVAKDSFGERTEEFRKEIIDFYLKGVEDKMEIARQAAHIMGDHMICIGNLRYVEKMIECGHEVYFYNFPYFNRDGFGILRWIFPFRAATHCMELRYVLGKGVISKFHPNSDDLKMLARMTTYFTNFAKYGNPNGKDIDGPWKKSSDSEALKHYSIQLEGSEMAENNMEERYKFWSTKVMPFHKSWLEANGETVENE